MNVLVLGLGNPERCDDGVGARVARQLDEQRPDRVSIRTRRGNMLDLLEDWAGFDVVICIDAAAAMGAPGKVYRFDPWHETLPCELGVTSSHAFGLAEAITLAQTLGQPLPAMLVYAVEGECFAHGEELSPGVAAAVPQVVCRVMADIRRLQTECSHA